MADISELDNYLNDKTAKENDVVEMIGAGLIEQKEDPQTKRKYRVINIPVRCNGRDDLVFTPNKDALKVLSDAFGSKTEQWIGKKFTIKFYPKTAFGKTQNAILPVVLKL